MLLISFVLMLTELFIFLWTYWTSVKGALCNFRIQTQNLNTILIRKIGTNQEKQAVLRGKKRSQEHCLKVESYKQSKTVWNCVVL